MSSRIHQLPSRLRTALLNGALLWLVGCGGAQGDGSLHADRAAVPAPSDAPSPETLPSRLEVPLPHGRLLLGAASPSSANVSLAIEAPRGQLVLTGCDWLEAHSSDEGVPLGDVAYRSTSSAERLVGAFPRSLLRRLFRTRRVLLQTCDEEVEVPAANMEAIRGYLAGRPPPAHEDVETRTLAMEGLRLQFRTRSLSPDTVEVDLDLLEPSIAPEDCMAVVAMVGGQTFELAELVPADNDNPVEHTRVTGDAVRVNAQILAQADDATLIVCGDPWPLDRWALENLRGLVGAPPEGAEIVRPEVAE
ncbi:MAG: hypothetical protein GXP55_02575 [Deltaproteobacteria bacterium]|nr:hypothetical protein [Deltaproteobacteria bacterium]